VDRPTTARVSAFDPAYTVPLVLTLPTTCRMSTFDPAYTVPLVSTLPTTCRVSTFGPAYTVPSASTFPTGCRVSAFYPSYTVQPAPTFPTTCRDNLVRPVKTSPMLPPLQLPQYRSAGQRRVSRASSDLVAPKISRVAKSARRPRDLAPPLSPEAGEARGRFADRLTTWVVNPGRYGPDATTVVVDSGTTSSQPVPLRLIHV
jgi:hypothetical protein